MKAEVVICGAGIAGIAAAYHLSVQRGVRDVVIVDELPPLSLTSDKSTECYRNWWPGPGDAMVAMTNRSIDILEALARESDNRFLLNRRGYLFATADENRIESMRRGARESCALGAGELREHGPGSGGADYVPAPTTGFENLPTGADLITDQALIRQHFPYLNDDTIAVVHARRCGWLSAQQLGMYMLEQARAGGARLLRGRVQAVDTAGGRVRGVHVAVSGATETISTNIFVNAAGPFFKQVGEMTGIDLPVFSESHVKLSFHDRRGALSQNAPLIIWNDPVHLPWSEEEREALAQKFGELRPQLGLHVQNTVIEAFKEGALSTKVKRLMALAIALGVGCRNCELHQAMSALDEGTTTEEILEVMDVVVSIRGTTGVAESLRIIQLLDELGKL